MKTTIKTSLAVCLSVLAFSTVPANAETLSLPQDPTHSDVTTPSPGTLMSDVESQYGAPQQQLDAVGEPPIARWIYSEFKVYFEHDRVIHSVSR